MSKLRVVVNSEIGKLRGVIIHTPGGEVENMTPENAERALYSDILNLSVASKEYLHLKGVLNRVTHTFEVGTLLEETLQEQLVKEELIRKIGILEENLNQVPYLLELPIDQLAKELIEGVILRRDNLTRFLSKERYSLRPLHNFLFTRDASMTVWNDVLIGRMANKVRERESLIMESIFKYHPSFGVSTINPSASGHLPLIGKATIEGGDLLVANEDVLLVGCGSRTSTQGVDYLIEMIKMKKTSTKHIIVQELPESPESFIHLDMTFTFLDRNSCMVYAPLILKNTKFHTILISIENGKVSHISEKENLLTALKEVGFDLEPIYCGGVGDPWSMEREQWHSGANFFAFAPGKVIGYERNEYTIQEMAKHGFEVISSSDLIEGIVDADHYNRAVITLPGGELARGGGGARCMTMPFSREDVQW